MDGVQIFKMDNAPQGRDAILNRISQIDALMDALMTTAMTTVTGGHIFEYELDNGQSRQRVKYTTVEQITNAIQLMQNMREMFETKLHSRNFRLMDQSNFRRRC